MLIRTIALMLAAFAFTASVEPAQANGKHYKHHSYKSGFKHKGHKSHKGHFKHRGFKSHRRGFGRYGFKGHHRGFGHRRFKGHRRGFGRHGGFSYGFGFNSFAPYRYHRPHRRLFHGAPNYYYVVPHAYSSQTAPWTTEPSAPAKTAPAATNVETPKQVTQQPAAPAPIFVQPPPQVIAPAPVETTALSSPVYEDIGLYQDPTAETFTAPAQTFVAPVESFQQPIQSLPIETIQGIPVETIPSFVTSEPVVTTPFQPQALPPIETVPFN